MDHNYIRVFDNAIPKSVCKVAIDLFEKEKELEEWDRQGRPQFQQYNITSHLEKGHNDWDQIQNALIESAHFYGKKYMDECDCTDFFPLQSSLEEFRMKKYRKGTNDRFDRHVDVGDYSSAKRFLALFWYLNTVTDGGETVFGDLKYSAIECRLLMFPPLWTFPHAGLPAISDDKYIVGTYCHYL